MKKIFLHFVFFLVLLGFGFSQKVYSSEEVLFSDIRFMGAELVDDMVYQWLKNPPFSTQTQLTLAEIYAPVSLDSRFNTLIENRLYELFQKNSHLNLSLIHCSSCQQYVTHSNPTRTIIRRGIDQPEILTGILNLSPNTLALSLNFETQGRELILQAHIFELAPPQKIVWAQKFSTNMGTRVSLREAQPLMSLEAARKMQDDIYSNREPIHLLTRLQIHNFQTTGNYSLPPLIFAEQSIESEVLPDRKQRVGVNVGITSIRDSYSGWTLGGRYAHLMLRETPSLIHPDLYWFFGIQYMRLQGSGAAIFAQDQLDISKLLSQNEDPKVSLTNYHFGFESLIKYRFGLSIYLEYIPALDESKIISKQSLIVPYHGVGTALVFQW